jgi:hypothetical protein
VLPRILVRRWCSSAAFGGIAVYLMSAASRYYTGDSFLIAGGYSLYRSVDPRSPSARTPGPRTAEPIRDSVSKQNSLRAAAPILIGVSIMLSLAMGLRQSLGLFVQPAVKDLSIAVADFTLAIAVQNLVWGFLQPLAGVWAVRFGFRRVMTGGAVLYALGLLSLATAGGYAGVMLGAGLLTSSLAPRWPASVPASPWRWPRARCHWHCAARCWASCRRPGRSAP